VEVVCRRCRRHRPVRLGDRSGCLAAGPGGGCGPCCGWRGGKPPSAGDNARRPVDGQRILKERRENSCAATGHGRRKALTTKDRCQPGATPVTPRAAPATSEEPGNRRFGRVPDGGGGPRGRGAGQPAPHDRNASQGPSISYMEGPWPIVPQRPSGARNDTLMIELVPGRPACGGRAECTRKAGRSWMHLGARRGRRACDSDGVDRGRPLR
jgi:hypothetical protein